MQLRRRHALMASAYHSASVDPTGTAITIIIARAGGIAIMTYRHLAVATTITTEFWDRPSITTANLSFATETIGGGGTTVMTIGIGALTISIGMETTMVGAIIVEDGVVAIGTVAGGGVETPGTGRNMAAVGTVITMVIGMIIGATAATGTATAEIAGIKAAVIGAAIMAIMVAIDTTAIAID